MSRVVTILLFIFMAMFVYPLIVMVFGAFKNSAELSANPAGFPLALRFENYKRLIHYSDGLFFRTLFNSLFISSVYAVLSIFIASMAAYAFSKFEFKGRNILFTIIVGTIMIPTELKMPALYIMFSKMGFLTPIWCRSFPHWPVFLLCFSCASI